MEEEEVMVVRNLKRRTRRNLKRRTRVAQRAVMLARKAVAVAGLTHPSQAALLLLLQGMFIRSLIINNLVYIFLLYCKY